jgi:hypothetical protein
MRKRAGKRWTYLIIYEKNKSERDRGKEKEKLEERRGEERNK